MAYSDVISVGRHLSAITETRPRHLSVSSTNTLIQYKPCLFACLFVCLFVRF